MKMNFGCRNFWQVEISWEIRLAEFSAFNRGTCWSVLLFWHRQKQACKIPDPVDVIWKVERAFNMKIHCKNMFSLLTQKKFATSLEIFIATLNFCNLRRLNVRHHQQVFLKLLVCVARRVCPNTQNYGHSKSTLFDGKMCQGVGTRWKLITGLKLWN